MRIVKYLKVTDNPSYFIDTLPLNEFIEWAKSYNIFQESNSKVYDRNCQQIKARLDREGLSHETVRPE